MMSGGISASCVALKTGKIQFSGENVTYVNQFALCVSSGSFFRSLTLQIGFLRICLKHRSLLPWIPNVPLTQIAQCSEASNSCSSRKLQKAEHNRRKSRYEDDEERHQIKETKEEVVGRDGTSLGGTAER